MSYQSTHTGAQIDQAVDDVMELKDSSVVVLKGNVATVPQSDVDKIFSNPARPVILDASEMSPKGGYIPCTLQQSSGSLIYIYAPVIKQGGNANQVYIQLRHGSITSQGALSLAYKAYALTQDTTMLAEDMEGGEPEAITNDIETE